MGRVRKNAAAGTAGLSLLLGALSGCKGEPGFASAGAASVAQFDVYVFGQEREDKGKGSDPDAALYGLTLDPLRVYRIPTAEPIDAVDASPTQVVVQTREGDSPRLGLLAADGSIGDIPGLGRPAGHDAQFLIDGRLRYTENAKPYRYLEFDPATKRTKTVRTTVDANTFDVLEGPGGSRIEVYEPDGKHVLRVATTKKTYQHKMPGDIGDVVAGEKWIAVGVDVDSSRPDEDGPAVLIVDPRTGTYFGDGFQGWAPLAWSADGKALLVRSTENEFDKRVKLGLVVVTGAAALREIGTIPYLRMETGSWVRGLPVDCDKYLCRSMTPRELEEDMERFNAENAPGRQ